MGWSMHGQLGHGETVENLANESAPSSPLPRPVLLSDSLRFVSISAGCCHSAAATLTGELYTWGWGINGRLGHGDRESRSQPQPVPLFSPRNHDAGDGGESSSLAVSSLLDGSRGKGAARERAVQVSCGDHHSACVTSGGDVYTWGWGKQGQLGHGAPMGNITAPRKVKLPDGSVEAALVACGWSHTIVVLSDGVVLAFGLAEAGQLGVGISPRGAAAAADEHDREGDMRGGGGSASSKHRRVQGVARSDPPSTSPTRVKPSRVVPTPARCALPDGAGRIIAASCGSQHTVVLAADGRCYAAGLNDDGQLGLGHRRSAAVFTGVDFPDDARIVQVACGDHHTSFLSADGRVFACGNNNYHQLGLGEDSDPRDTPVEVPLGSVRCASIACGAYHTAAVIADGEPLASAFDEATGALLPSSLAKGTTAAQVRPAAAEGAVPPLPSEEWRARFGVSEVDVAVETAHRDLSGGNHDASDAGGFHPNRAQDADPPQQQQQNSMLNGSGVNDSGFIEELRDIERLIRNNVSSSATPLRGSPAPARGSPFRRRSSVDRSAASSRPGAHDDPGATSSPLRRRSLGPGSASSRRTSLRASSLRFGDALLGSGTPRGVDDDPSSALGAGGIDDSGIGADLDLRPPALDMTLDRSGSSHDSGRRQPARDAADEASDRGHFSPSQPAPHAPSMLSSPAGSGSGRLESGILDGAGVAGTSSDALALKIAGAVAAAAIRDRAGDADAIAASLAPRISAALPGPLADTLGARVSDTLAETIARDLRETLSVDVAATVAETVSETVTGTVSETVSETVSKVVSQCVSQSVAESVSESVSRCVPGSVSAAFAAAIGAEIGPDAPDAPVVAALERAVAASVSETLSSRMAPIVSRAVDDSLAADSLASTVTNAVLAALERFDGERERRGVPPSLENNDRDAAAAERLESAIARLESLLPESRVSATAPGSEIGAQRDREVELLRVRAERAEARCAALEKEVSEGRALVRVLHLCAAGKGALSGPEAVPAESLARLIASQDSKDWE